MIDHPQPAFFQRLPDAAAAVVPHHDHVPHVQHFDGVLQHRQAIHVGWMHHIRHIAMHEDFARQQVHNFIRRHAAIGTADPQILRILLRRQVLEEMRVLRPHPRGPLQVLFK